MNENHRDKAESNLVLAEDMKWMLSRKSKLWVPKHKRRAGFTDKTLWDWIQLAIQLFGAIAIPVAIAIGTLWFSSQQNLTSVQIAQDNRKNDLKIADDQQQEATLKTYLDDMS